MGEGLPETAGLCCFFYGVGKHYLAGRCYIAKEKAFCWRY